VSPGETVDAEIVINNPNISPYCFDDDNRRVIFAELPDGIDLSTVPFVYHTQYEEAIRLIAVPYETFNQIAQTLPPIEHLIIIYISGRSGSTLLSHIFNAVDNVVSFSEPDVITQFAYLRTDDNSRSTELSRLANSAMRVLFKSKQDKTCAIKVRSQALRAMDLFQQTFPAVKNLYSYRDIVGYASSFYRVLKQFGSPEYSSVSDTISYYDEQFDYDMTPYIENLIPGAEEVSLVQFLTLQWIICMEWYLAQANNGIPVLPVRYADLKTANENILAGIFEHCAIPVEQVANTLKVFEQDSQAGSPIARINPNEGNKLRLTDEQLQEMNRILQRHPVINTMDYIIPGTLEG